MFSSLFATGLEPLQLSTEAMKIAYYMPFKPLDHPNPSGDLVIGTELYRHLHQRGHSIELASQLRLRWFYYQPMTMLRLAMEAHRLLKKLKDNRPDIWLTYHSYYKAPDLLGKYCCQRLNIPYVIFQGIYSTKRRKRITTRPGFHLNRQALLAADHIFTNKRKDYKNLTRIIPPDQLDYIPPGIHPEAFPVDAKAGQTLRADWGLKNETIIMTAAMMRPGVKAEGVATVIDNCAQLLKTNDNIYLIIAGDGECRKELTEKADQLLHNKVRFLGKIPRQELYRYYNAADIFMFPGVDESLGMVYLEAQSCGLPVVAYQDWGGGEAVIHQKTGLLSPFSEANSLFTNISQLARDRALRTEYSQGAIRHIRANHDLQINYSTVEQKLKTAHKLAHGKH